MYLHKNKRYHIQVCSNEVLTIEKKKFLWSLNRQKRQGMVWDSILTVNISGLKKKKKKTPGEEWVRQPKNYYFWWHGQKKLWMGMLCKKLIFFFMFKIFLIHIWNQGQEWQSQYGVPWPWIKVKVIGMLLNKGLSACCPLVLVTQPVYDHGEHLTLSHGVQYVKGMIWTVTLAQGQGQHVICPYKGTSICYNMVKVRRQCHK